MIRYHYQIRDSQNNVIHESKNGIAKKGFDDPVAASEDGNLIMDIKYPEQPYYVYVYPEDENSVQEPVQFMSKYCIGERCMCCGEQAVEKVEQVVFDDHPYPNHHPYTGYLCRKHFEMVLMPYKDQRNIEQMAKDEWEKLGDMTGSGTIPWECWEYYLKAFQTAIQMNIPPRVNKIVEKVQAVIEASAYKAGEEPSDYEHGKHTAASMILDDINEIFYGTGTDKDTEEQVPGSV